MTATREIPHGTTGGYTRHGCRCDECRAARARWLRESGSNRRVGKRREQKDAWEEAQRHPCAECGRPGVWRKHKLCADCYRRELREATDARRAEIQRRWLAGETHRQIAQALGSTAPSIQVELVRMRQLGWDVPRRGARGKALA